MLNYSKLWKLLESRGMKRTDLKEIMSANTLAKLGKNEVISSSVIEKICAFLNCQPGDIMEYISKEQIRATVEQFDNINKTIIEQLQEQGITKEQYAAMMSQIMPEMIEGLYSGRNPLTELFDKEMQSLEEKK